MALRSQIRPNCGISTKCQLFCPNFKFDIVLKSPCNIRFWYYRGRIIWGWSVHLIKFKALNFSLKKIIFQNMERKNTKTVRKWDSKWPRSLKRSETDLTRRILISKCKGFQDIACICLIFEVIQAMGDGYILFSFQSNSNNAMSGKLNAVFWSADQNLN